MRQERRMRYLILSGLLGCTLGGVASAQSEEIDTRFCSVAGLTEIIFVNGKDTDYAGAMKAAFELNTAIVEEIGIAEELAQFVYRVAYYPTSRHEIKVLEAVAEQLSETLDQVETWWIDFDNAPQIFKDAYRDELIVIEGLNEDEQEALDNHIAYFKDAIGRGRQVLVVSHGRGNLYANRAFDGLSREERPSYGIVSAANPFDTVNDARSPTYVTIEEDSLTNNVPGALPSNIANTAAFEGLSPLNHSFLESYMASGSPSRQRIVDDILDEQEIDLIPRTAVLGDGIITVTLTWNTTADYDLHIFEPDGTGFGADGEHVYFLNFEGTAGVLDVDDTNGFGPENYFVSCQTILLGAYEVHVQDYSGGPTGVAQIRMTAGGETISMQMQPTVFDVENPGYTANFVASILVTEVEAPSGNTLAFNIKPSPHPPDPDP